MILTQIVAVFILVGALGAFATTILGGRDHGRLWAPLPRCVRAGAFLCGLALVWRGMNYFDMATQGRHLHADHPALVGSLSAAFFFCASAASLLSHSHSPRAWRAIERISQADKRVRATAKAA